MAREDGGRRPVGGVGVGAGGVGGVRSQALAEPCWSLRFTGCRQFSKMNGASEEATLLRCGDLHASVSQRRRDFVGSICFSFSTILSGGPLRSGTERFFFSFFLGLFEFQKRRRIPLLTFWTNFMATKPNWN